VIWKQTDLKYSPVHGNGGSPILVGNALIFSCDGGSDPFVVALDKASGKVLWKVKRDTTAKKNFSFSTPTLIAVNGQQQLITPGSGVVCALDPKTGAELWRCRYGEGYSVIPKPVFGHGMIFLSSGYDKPVLHAIRVDGKGDVTDTHLAWKLEKGAPHTPSPLLVGNEIYLVSDAGIASCLDAKTGTVHWSERVAGNYSASPLLADGKIYLQNETGTGVVLKPGKTFEKLAENPLAEKTLASYAVTDGALFIRTEKHLYRIGGK
jgi:outer membrane protein assembly factor BamB